MRLRLLARLQFNDSSTPPGFRADLFLHALQQQAPRFVARECRGAFHRRNLLDAEPLQLADSSLGFLFPLLKSTLSRL